MSSWFGPIVALAMLVYALLLFGSTGQGDLLLLAMLSAPLVYFLTMFLYYGLARLSFQRSHLWTWGGAAVAIGLSMFLIQGRSPVSILAGWGAILAAGVVCGALTRQGRRNRDTYIIGATVLLAMAGLQYYPMWQQAYLSSAELVGAARQWFEEAARTMGESPEGVRLMADRGEQMAAMIIRLMPAGTLLSALVQFSIGYLAFLVWLERARLVRPRLEPFRYWKMPYGFVSVVVVLAGLRLLDGELTSLVADNGLLIMGVFYSVIGLAIVEYYMRRLQLSRALRITFYILLVLLPLVHLVVAGILAGLMVLAGFIDSFADWRKVRLREFM